MRAQRPSATIINGLQRCTNSLLRITSVHCILTSPRYHEVPTKPSHRSPASSEHGPIYFPFASMSTLYRSITRSECLPIPALRGDNQVLLRASELLSMVYKFCTASTPWSREDHGCCCGAMRCSSWEVGRSVEHAAKQPLTHNRTRNPDRHVKLAFNTARRDMHAALQLPQL